MPEPADLRLIAQLYEAVKKVTSPGVRVLLVSERSYTQYASSCTHIYFIPSWSLTKIICRKLPHRIQSAASLCLLRKLLAAQNIVGHPQLLSTIQWCLSYFQVLSLVTHFHCIISKSPQIWGFFSKTESSSFQFLVIKFPE